MKLIPRGAFAIARLVDVHKSMLQTIELPDDQKANVSVMAIIDTVGPKFTQAKVGDLVAYGKCRHFILRNMMHAGLIHDDDVLAVVECPEHEKSMLKIEPATFENGRVAAGDPIVAERTLSLIQS